MIKLLVLVQFLWLHNAFIRHRLLWPEMHHQGGSIPEGVAPFLGTTGEQGVCVCWATDHIMLVQPASVI